MSFEQWELGVAAVERSDWVEACDLFEGILDPNSDATAGQFIALGQAAFWVNDLDTTIAARERAFSVYRDGGDDHAAALLALELAHDHALKMREAVSNAWVNRARRLLVSHPESAAAAHMARWQARAALDGDGDPESALIHIDEALRIARQVGDRDLEMLVTHDRGQIMVTMGLLEEGMPLMEEAMLAAASGELTPNTVGKIYCNMIAACLDTADYGAAAQWTDQAERWCEGASADSGYPGICRVRRSEINRRRGLLDAAEEGARRAAQELKNFIPFAAAAHAEIGNVHLQRGELDLAEAEFSTAHQFGDSAMPGLALLRSAQGQTVVAAGLIRSAMESLPDGSLARARLLPSAVELFLESGDIGDARDLVDEMERIASRFGSSALRAAASYARGLVAGEDGDLAEATLRLRSALTTWMACGLPYDAARARLALGRRLAESGAAEAATLEIRAAAVEFEQLEARLDLKEARALLGEDEPAPDQGAEALALLSNLDIAALSRYMVVGAYARFDEGVRNRLADARQRIGAGLVRPTGNRDNHLVWAAPGSGKTFLVEQIAAGLDGVRYVELNLARLSEDEFRAALLDATSGDGPCLVLIDEVDAKPDASWPYEVLLPFLDVNVDRGGHVVFVMAGSSGASIDAMKHAIGSRPKGADLLSRTPTDNEFVVAPLGVGDQILVALSQARQAAARSGSTIRAAEKAALYYLSVTPYLANARQLAEFMARAVDRMPPGEDRLKYDHLFSPGDPENKQFWMKLDGEASAVVDSYVTIQ